MPRFSAFGRRKSTADSLDAAALAEASPSFRVLERSEVNNGKSFDGGARLAAKMPVTTRTTAVDVPQLDDNIFADMKINRGSGSSNTTKTNSTDNSSRHSNASTAPSSADLAHHEEWRISGKKTYSEIPVPPVPKSRSSGFLSAAGRSFSFGGQKKSLPPAPVEEESWQQHPLPPTPQQPYESGSRARATTTSTTSTATPPKIEQDFNMDMGGDFGKMLMGFDKRQSVAMRDDARQGPTPRSLTGNRMTQPSPIHIDRTSKIEASPYSWNSHRSDDNLLASPISIDQGPPRRNSPLATRPHVPASNSDNSLKSNHALGRTPSFGDDEESKLLKDSLSNAKRFLSGTPVEAASSARYRQTSYESSRFDPKAGEDDNLFDTGLLNSSRTAQRYVARKPSPPRNKVMTPAEFERYRQDRERVDSKPTNTTTTTPDDDDDEEPTYEDDEDEVEKSRQAAKQRRKQEAHMTVYRQQMMKVTGEAAGGGPSRPSMSMSFSTPNLTALHAPLQGPSPTGGSDNSDEDEEVPLAILAAHGFPNKARAPSRLATMASNPNLRIAQTPSYQRPGSVVNEAGPGGRLPVFARNLPQDPYVGAGLVHSATRESLHFGGGSSTPPNSQLPPGGLVGVIANEERSRAMRRGSPALEVGKSMPLMGGPQQFDPVAGIPSQMMYPQMANMSAPMLGGNDQAAQMNQQMQFMQMQMQLMQMQMMAHGGGGGAGQRMSYMPGQSMLNAPGIAGMGTPDAMRHSFMDNGSIRDSPNARPMDMHMRTMSMVQPSSASWIQPPQPGYAPSIRIQGANGYAPSIAPSERSNIGLPGRYRPVSQAIPQSAIPPMPSMDQLRKSVTMSGALGGGAGWEQGAPNASRQKTPSPLLKVGNQDDEDDEEGWEAMKAKREKKRSLWRSKKTTEHSDIGALIS